MAVVRKVRISMSCSAYSASYSNHSIAGRVSTSNPNPPYISLCHILQLECVRGLRD